MPDVPAKIGRPSDYTPELADEICRLLSEGESMRTICTLEGFPSQQTVYTWLRVHKAFLENYVRAREDQGDTYADRIGDISLKTLTGEYEPNAARVAIDGLKWYAGKLAPKKYSDRNEGPLAANITVVVHRDGAMIDVTPPAPMIEHKGDDDLS